MLETPRQESRKLDSSLHKVIMFNYFCDLRCLDVYNDCVVVSILHGLSLNVNKIPPPMFILIYPCSIIEVRYRQIIGSFNLLKLVLFTILTSIILHGLPYQPTKIGVLIHKEKPHLWTEQIMTAKSAVPQLPSRMRTPILLIMEGGPIFIAYMKFIVFLSVILVEFHSKSL